jgi:hypothetical protein
MAAALNLADLALIRITGAVATAIVYLAAFAWKIRRRRPCVKVNSRPPEAAEGLTSQGTRVFDLPRTKDLRVEKVRSWYEEMIGEYDKETRYSKLGWRFPLTCEPLVPAALVLALLAGAVAAGTDKPSWVDIVSGAGLALATVIGTAICGWTWWRMSDTLFAFLRTFMLVTKDPPANRARCELA